MNGFENISILNLNPHLNMTSPDSFYFSIFRAYILGFSVLFGPPTHAYILWLIVRGRGIASEFLNFNISICEIIICVNYYIILLSKLPASNPYLLFSVGFYMTGRPLFQCVICVERYLAVVHPVTFLKSKPFRYRLICCVIVWFLTLSSSLFSMFTASAHVFVYMCGILLQFLFFFSVNLYSCLAVLWALMKPGPGDRGKEKEEENHMKRRAFCIILIISLTLIVMFAPALVLMFLYFFLSDKIFVYSSYSFLCFVLAGFVQPVLYFHRAGKLNFFCRK